MICLCLDKLDHTTLRISWDRSDQISPAFAANKDSKYYVVL
jgi:hypothetical protein